MRSSWSMFSLKNPKGTDCSRWVLDQCQVLTIVRHQHIHLAQTPHCINCINCIAFWRLLKNYWLHLLLFSHIPLGLTKYIKYPPLIPYLMLVTGCLHRSPCCLLRIRRWNNGVVSPMLVLESSQMKKMPFLFHLLAPGQPLVRESMLTKEEESCEGAWWTPHGTPYLNATEAFLPLWHQTEGWHSSCFPFQLSLWYAFFLKDNHIRNILCFYV